jgi:hypothetical protein
MSRVSVHCLKIKVTESSPEEGMDLLIDILRVQNANHYQKTYEL